MAEISSLRRRMIEHMTVRNLSPATQQSYLNAISKFSRYFGRSPDRLNSAVILGMTFPAGSGLGRTLPAIA
jgi:integrase/recombinase XerD